MEKWRKERGRGSFPILSLVLRTVMPAKEATKSNRQTISLHLCMYSGNLYIKSLYVMNSSVWRTIFLTIVIVKCYKKNTLDGYNKTSVEQTHFASPLGPSLYRGFTVVETVIQQAQNRHYLRFKVWQIVLGVKTSMEQSMEWVFIFRNLWWNYFKLLQSFSKLTTRVKIKSGRQTLLFLLRWI